LVAGYPWTRQMAPTMAPRRTTDVRTAGVRWGAMEIWSHVTTMSASASGSTWDALGSRWPLRAYGSAKRAGLNRRINERLRGRPLLEGGVAVQTGTLVLRALPRRLDGAFFLDLCPALNSLLSVTLSFCLFSIEFSHGSVVASSQIVGCQCHVSLTAPPEAMLCPRTAPPTVRTMRSPP